MTTTTSSTASAASSIITALGAGSGIDTASLVSQLVAAQFATKNDTLTRKNDTLTAQISAVGKLQSDISSFASALSSLIKGGSLSTQPTTSNASVLGAAALVGAHVGTLSASVEVDRLATAQSTATVATFASRTATVGTGNLTLTFGNATVDNGAITGFTPGAAAPVTIAIDSDHNTLDAIASTINAAKAGVTASIVTDADGTARLALKGATGTAQGFTISGDTPELAQFNVGVGEAATSVGSAALNAQVKLDGVAVERSSNIVSDLITGVKLSLTSVSDKPVTIGSTAPADALSQAVNDFVETYNQFIAGIAKETNATGELHQDNAAVSLQRSLGKLTSTQLTPTKTPGVPSTLAEIGVSTNRDGTLAVNATQLAAALADNPAAVEQIFANGSAASGAGIGGAINNIATTAANVTYGLAASTTRYTKAQADIAIAQAQATTDASVLSDRLTAQYAALNSRVTAYKQSQTFLQQQIDAWNAQKN